MNKIAQKLTKSTAQALAPIRRAEAQLQTFFFGFHCNYPGKAAICDLIASPFRSRPIKTSLVNCGSSGCQARS